MATEKETSKIDPTELQIYSALLGSNLKIARRPLTLSRLKFWARGGACEHLPPDSPFHRPTLKENIKRAATSAINALNEASDRLKQSKKMLDRPPGKPAPTNTASATPIILIGPAAGRNSPPVAPSHRSVAA